MATITTILGTDSVSSSRVTINDNFASINSDLANIEALLDTNNETITLTGAGSFGSLAIATNKVTINSTAMVSAVPTTVNATFTLGADEVKSVTNVASGDLPAANQFTSNVYNITGSGITSVNLNVGNPGQAITIISEAGSVAVSTTQIAGISSLTIAQYGAIDLKFIGTKWYIVGQHGCTIA